VSRRTWLTATGVRRSFASAAVVVAVAIGATTLPLTVASAQDPAAVRAAQEIQAARDRASAAAQAMFDAESRLDTLEVEIVAAERDLATVEARPTRCARACSRMPSAVSSTPGPRCRC
jgi:hypothetical protein